MVGFGFSDRPDGIAYTMDVWVQQALDLLDALGVLAGLPTVVVTGEMDVLTPPSHGVALAAALGAPAPLRVPDGGHLLPRQQPAVVAHALASLLAAAPA